MAYIFNNGGVFLNNNNNVDMNQVLGMLAKMNKNDLEAGIALAQQILKTKETGKKD